MAICEVVSRAKILQNQQLTINTRINEKTTFKTIKLMLSSPENKEKKVNLEIKTLGRGTLDPL